MKKSFLLSLTLLSLAACKKEANISLKITPTATTAVVSTKPDTIPDKAEFKLKLGKDSTNTDETAIVFDHRSSVNYSGNEDAPYFTGFGQVSLASISADNRDLAINTLPYTPGMSIRLDIHTKTDGVYFLKMSYENGIPANIQVWLKDNYLKDSVNARTDNYIFNVSKADTNSFGSKRFKLILKDSSTQ
jgi:hypothetical protein